MLITILLFDFTTIAVFYFIFLYILSPFWGRHAGTSAPVNQSVR